MATSLLQPSTSTSLSSPQGPIFPCRSTNRDLGPSAFLGRTSLSRGSNLLLSVLPVPSRLWRRRKGSLRCEASSSGNVDHIPKQFHEENLIDGLMENFKNVPSSLYGLSPSQMDIFMSEDSLIARQSQKVTEESISSVRHYTENGGMSLTGVRNGPSKFSMRVSTYLGGRPYSRRSAPPDLPSLLLDGRIVYLGMPIVPSVTELVVAEFMWLDYDNPTKPIYFYINSTGTQNDIGETIGSETDAYAIADCINKCRCRVYTVNIGTALGQAGMLLSLGTKGYRFVQPNAFTKLLLPESGETGGVTSDMWIRAKELEANTEYYIELLARGIGKPKEEIREDVKLPKVFLPKDAIEYGIADKIIPKGERRFEKRNYDEMLAQSKAMRRKAIGPESAASGFS